MSRVLVNGQDVNYTSDFPEMTYDKWKALPEDLRPNYTVITDRDYTGEPIDNSVSVTADGVKTYATLLNELQALVDYSKVTRNTALVTVASGERTIYRLTQNIESSSRLCFDRTRVYPPSTYKITTYTYILEPSNSHIYYAHYSTNYDFGDADASVPASGVTFTLYYNIVSSGWGMDIQAEDVSYGSSNVKAALDNLTANNISMSSSTQLQSGTTPFTAPSDGYLIVNSTSSSTTAYVALGTVPLMTQFNGSSSVWGWGNCFLRKGTEVNIIVNGTGSYYYFASLT